MGHGQISDFIISECLSGQGRGQLFLRRDGLENTPERVKAREEYLEAHPETSAQYRRAILAAGITPGMTRWEVVAAWGLDEKERNSAYCRETADGHSSYQSWHAFKIGGTSYTLYIAGDMLSSISYGPQDRPNVQPLEEEVRQGCDETS
jgi:hypothetical protein